MHPRSSHSTSSIIITPIEPPADASVAIWAALLAAVVAALGSLWLTMGMELEACPLCYYQRTCVLGVVGILAVGLMLKNQSAAALGVLALPVAVAGLGVGLMHNYLEFTGKLECPHGIGGFGTAPQQALAVQAILVVILLIAGHGRIAGLLVAVLLGGGIAWLLFATAPKPKAMSREAYKSPPKMCRMPDPNPEGKINLVLPKVDRVGAPKLSRMRNTWS